MDSPRIIAVADVCLTAPATIAQAVRDFYTELVGLDESQVDTDAGRVVFRGYPRSGPRLIVDFGAGDDDKLMRRQVLIQVASLINVAEMLADQRVDFEFSRGWSYYDRRLTALDPAANRVEMVTSHPW